MTLENNCVTDETIAVPDGVTLDGNSHTITAQDPAAGHFTGAVVANAGDEAYVTDLTVTADGLASACDGGADRLRGIMFEGASGAITQSEVIGINQGPSGCQEGNAIEVRNEPFDGTGANPVTVVIAHNSVDAFQKSGIVANGNVDVKVTQNRIGHSSTQEYLAANSIQLGFGALGSVEYNHIEGNQWLGASDYAATAVLLYLPGEGVAVDGNNVNGNSDAGIYAYGSGLTIDNNRIFDNGVDGEHGDYGIINETGSGAANAITNNKIRGFADAYYGVETGKNKTIPDPQG